VDHGGREESQGTVVVLVVVPGEEDMAEGPSVLEGPEEVGKLGRYFIVLNWDSEKGLSFETWGRRWVFTTPRSAKSKATGLLVMDVPRSAWSVSCPGSIPCFSHVSPMRRSAKAALSR
jgi:hypothetical protein